MLTVRTYATDRPAGARAAGLHPPHRIDASSADARLLNTTMQQAESWPRYEDISRLHDPELDGVISKPWGHEYRIYRDPFFDVWLLTIEPGHKTSEHCHPRKSTALICLSGTGRLSVLAGTYLLGAGDVVVIGKGAFHSTENVGDQPLELIEIEVPRNKFDLVRAEDHYGRRASPYTDPSVREIPAAALVDAPLRDNAKYRPASATGRSRFDVVRGDSITAHREGTFYAALSLATSCALSDTITLLASEEERANVVDPDGVYFTILDSASPKLTR